MMQMIVKAEDDDDDEVGDVDADECIGGGR